ETSVVAVGAACGTPRTPFFEGCSPFPRAPSYASATAIDVLGAEDVGAASASAKRHSSKGKGGRGGGGGSGGGGGGSSGGSGGSRGGGNGGRGDGSGGAGGSSGGSGGSGGSGSGGSSGGRTGAPHGGSGGGQRQRQQRRSETPVSCPYVIRTGDRAGQTCGRPHTQHRSFSHLDDAWHAEFGDVVERPHWVELLRSGVAIFDLDYDAIISAMYALSASAEGDCYRCVPPDPCIEAVALGNSESSLPATAPAEALHTFTLDSGASRCFFRDSTTLTPLPAPVLDSMVTTTTPGGQHVSICTCTLTGRHLATFTRRPGSTLYTLATEPPQVAASAQVSALGPVAPPCSCRLLSHQTLLWHHRLGHPSLPRLRGMHSRLLVSGLPRSLPPLPPSPTPPCLPCVERRQRAAPHSSSFRPTTAPLQTLHMDVKDQVVDVLIPWNGAVHLQLHERFHQDLPVLCLHYDKGGEFSSDLLRDFCRGEGILYSFTHPASPQKNGIVECRIVLDMEVTRTSMIHAAAPHFLWPFAVRYAAHQLKLWPRVSLPETSPTLRWTGKVGDASVFRVWGSRAFVRDTSADKLSARAIPCVFLGFVPDASCWQFYHPTSRRVFPSQDVTFDESVPSTGPASSGVSEVDPLPGTVPVEVAGDSSAARGAASGGAEPGGAEPGGADSEGAGSGDAEPGGAEPGGTEPAGVELWGAEPKGVEPGGVESECAESGGAKPWGAASSGAAGAGCTGDTGPGGAGVTDGAGGTAAAGPRGARTRGTGAVETGGVGGSGTGDPMEPGAAVSRGARAGGTGAGGSGAGGAGAGCTGACGAGAGGVGAGGTGTGGTRARGAVAVEPRAGGTGAGGTVRKRSYLVPFASASSWCLVFYRPYSSPTVSTA
ncbi:unnamed protein product, partial [Closterium sp. NIES-54]